jgi:hypothetical protein
MYTLKFLLVGVLTISLLPTDAFAVAFDYNKIQTSQNSGKSVVSKNHFGSIFTTFLTLTDYDTALTGVAEYGVRWPGGALAEKKPDKYGFNYKDIYNEPEAGDSDYYAGRQKGLTETMAYAVRTNQSFSMIIPTLRYMDDPSVGQVELEGFLIKLLKGDFGPLPQDFTLEIGNETAHIGWEYGSFTPGPGSYGYLANEFLSTINRVLNDTVLNPNKVNLKVTTQLGTTKGGQNTIYNQISKANLKTVDAFVRHSGLVNTADEYMLSVEDEKLKVAKKYWSAAWGGNPPAFVVYDSAWNIGGSEQENNVSGADKIDVGARQAGAMVQLFGKMMAGGSDRAAIWGVQDTISSHFFHKGERISHGGHAFRLMADSLPGTSLLAGKVGSGGGWQQTAKNYDVIGYKGADRVIFYVLAKDIPAGGISVPISLTNFGKIGSVTYETVRSTVAPSPSVSRLTEVPLVSTGWLQFGTSTFSYKLAQDYEMARITVMKK